MEPNVAAFLNTEIRWALKDFLNFETFWLRGWSSSGQTPAARAPLRLEVPRAPRACEPSHFRPSGAAFSREPGLCDAHFSPVLMQEAKPYTNEKEHVCALCAALSSSAVPARREAASPLSKAMEEEKPARDARDHAEGPRSRGQLSRPEGEELAGTGVSYTWMLFPRTAGTFQAGEQGREGAAGDAALWDWWW